MFKLKKIKKSYFLLNVSNLILLLIFFSIVPAAIADELPKAEATQLTLSSAIDKALKQSEVLQNAGKEVKKTEEWRDYYAEQLGYVPTSAAGTAAVEVPWAKLLSSDLEWRMSKKTLTAKEDQIVMDTCSKFWNVLVAHEEVKADEISLNAALKSLQSTRAAYQLGLSLFPTMTPQEALNTAEAQYVGAQAALAEAKNKLDSAFISLNYLIGLDPNVRSVLTDTVEFKNLSVVDLETEISQIVESSPEVWNTQQLVNMQEYLQDMMFYTGEYRPYEARKLEVEQAELTAATTKKEVEKGIRIMYYYIRNMEEGYNGLLELVKVAEENLRVTKLKYDLGMATAAEVASYEKALADARLSAFNMVYNHAYMKLGFQKPWAYSASAMMQ